MKIITFIGKGHNILRKTLYLSFEIFGKINLKCGYQFLTFYGSKMGLISAFAMAT